MSNTTDTPTAENQKLVLDFQRWPAAQVAAFVTTCEAVCRTLRREGKHEQLAEFFEGLALRGGELVRVRAQAEGQQRQRHSLN